MPVFTWALFWKGCTCRKVSQELTVIWTFTSHKMHGEVASGMSKAQKKSQPGNLMSAHHKARPVKKKCALVKIFTWVQNTINKMYNKQNTTYRSAENQTGRR